MQELPNETFARSRIVVDSYATVMDEVSDIIKTINTGLIKQSDMQAEIGEIVLGKKTSRQTDDEITFFKSVGNAVQDGTAAQRHTWAVNLALDWLRRRAREND